MLTTKVEFPIPDCNMKSKVTFELDKFTLLRDYTPLSTIKPKAPLTPTVVKVLSNRLQRAIRSKDKIAIIEIFTSCSNRQRQQVRVQYEKDYNSELCADLKKKFSGDFQEVILSLLSPPVELICRHLNRAMTGLVTNEKTLVELLVPRTNAEMRRISDAYDIMYNRPLVEHVCSSTSKNFRRLLTLIMMGNRDESTVTDDARARELAAKLYNDAEVKHSRDHTIFNRILSRENFAQLRLVFDQYEEISGGNTIEEAVSNQMSGDIYDGIIAIIECVRYMPGFFAGCLFRALKGWSTDDTALIRVLVTRSEIDLENIKQSYQQIYNKELHSEIEFAVSGEYKCALLAILATYKG